jgi:hypothetical protein
LSNFQIPLNSNFKESGELTPVVERESMRRVRRTSSGVRILNTSSILQDQPISKSFSKRREEEG